LAHPKKHFMRFFFLLLLAVTILTACDVQDPNQRVALPQIFSAQDDSGGTITLHYPARWLARPSPEVDGAGIIAFGNSQSALDAQVIDFEGDQIRGVVVMVLNNASLEAVDITTRPTPAEVLAVVGDQNSDNTLFTFDFGNPLEITVNNRPVAYIDGTTSYGGIAYDTINLVVDVGTGFIVMTFGTANGEIDTYLPEIRSIAGEIEYVSEE